MERYKPSDEDLEAFAWADDYCPDAGICPGWNIYCMGCSNYRRYKRRQRLKSFWKKVISFDFFKNK